jgi:hypothetical protein
MPGDLYAVGMFLLGRLTSRAAYDPEIRKKDIILDRCGRFNLKVTHFLEIYVRP